MTKSPRRRDLPCPVVAITPPSASHFFGFYDICPWSADGRQLLMLRFSGQAHRYPQGERAEVCVWTPETGEVEPIGTTEAYNFQMGARERWLADGGVMFNDVEGGRETCRIVTSGGTPIRTLEMAVASLNAAETLGVSPNFAHVSREYPAYGYLTATNPDIPHGDPDGDGLWQVDIASGRVSLMLSFADLTQAAGIIWQPGHFTSHPLFADIGDNLLIYLDINTDANSCYTIMLCRMGASGELRVLNRERNSHPAWRTADELIMWCRTAPMVGALRSRGLLNWFGLRHMVKLARRWQGPLRKRLLAEGFFQIDVRNPATKALFARDVITEDGHPSIHPRLPIMVCDTYPDADRKLHLFLYSFESGERVDVASFFHGVDTPDEALRCDLHPRWDRTGTLVSVDICENGVRRNAIVDVSQAIASIT